MHVINFKQILFTISILFSFSLLLGDEENCISCHQYKLLGRIDSTGYFHNYFVDEDAFKNSVHGRLVCTSCHSDVIEIPHIPTPKEVNCTQTCHIKDPFDGSPFSHAEIGEKLQISIHGTKQDNKDIHRPSCTNCHVNSEQIIDSNHNLLDDNLQNCSKCHKAETLESTIKHIEFHGENGEFWTQERKMSVCANCHSDTTLVGEIFSDNMVSSFLDTYHGVGFKFGDDRLPICSDCHGYHDIFSEEDIRSSVNPIHLNNTCGGTGCHADASDTFVQGSMHFRYEGFESQVLLWIKKIYLWIIAGVIGFMLIHNILDYFRIKQFIKDNPIQHNPNAKKFVRLNKPERISHIIMFMSFTGLALSGSLLWLPAINDNPYIPEWLYNGVFRQWTHRVFAVLLTLVSCYHIGYAFFNKRGRMLLMRMIPKPIDAKNIFQNIGYLLHLRKHPPKMPYFNYAEKMEYFAFAWGTVVMTLTGIILWFEHLGPKFWVDVARLVHSLEAILAILAIIVWHFYLVHWRPGKFPMSNAWITGNITEHEAEEEHGLDIDLFEEDKNA